MDDDENALKYANEGIEECIQNKSMYILHALYYRKATALYYLKRDEKEYMRAFRNSVNLLEMQNMDEMRDLYIKVTKEQYDIDLS